MTWHKGAMHRFVCDYKPTGYCTEEFRSASMVSMLADQLRAGGWSIIVRTGKGPHDWRDVKALVGRDHDRVHLCPGHKPALVGRMSAMRTDSG